MGIGSLIGAGISAFGASSAANQSKKAAQAAAQAQIASTQMAVAQQNKMFEAGQNNIAPYLALGSSAAGQLGGRLGELTTSVPLPPAMSQSDLEATPGYQFTLSQGLKATQNSAAARGLGLSGAAMKAAGAYATGLSDQTYNTRFNQGQQLWQDQVTNQTNNYNRLIGPTQVGASAAAGQAQVGAVTGNNIANNLISGGNAAASGILGAGQAGAAGTLGVTNALNNGLQQYSAQSGGLNLNNLLSQFGIGGGVGRTNDGGIWT